MRDRVLVRFLAARVQLAPAFEHVEKLVKAEKWAEARDAIQAFLKPLGVFFLGADRISVHTEWFSGMDHEDKKLFDDWISRLHHVYTIAYERAVESKYPTKFEWQWMDNILHNLRNDLSWLQEVMRDESDAFKHGHFDIIPLKGVTSTDEAVRTLDEAAGHVQHKFPKVLYGKVYIRKDLRPKGSYDARFEGGGMVAGAYQAATDTITLSMYATPNRTSVHTLIHEFGHRYHTRFMKGEKRERFIQLSTVGDVQEAFFPLTEREKFADEWIARTKGFRDDENFGNGGPVHLSERADFFFAGFPRDEFKKNVIPFSRRFDEGDDSVVPELRKALARAQFGGNLRVVKNEENLAPVYASDYGMTSWEENFADSFLAFCMGQKLPDPLQEFMASL